MLGTTGGRFDGIVKSGDNTMVCTKQFCSYRDRAEDFASLDAILAGLRNALLSSAAFILQPIDLPVVDATTSISRDVLTDPWDRFIVGTARALALPLVTRDNAIPRDSAGGDHLVRSDP
jgi:hypothetical protein